MTPDTTPAIRLKSAGRVDVGEVAVAPPGDGEVLLMVLAVGLCGSDAHWYQTGEIGDARNEGDLILGHEFSGVIESGPRTGERVAVDPAIPCLECEQCRAGHHNVCTSVRFAGHGATDGALRGHLVWPERCLVPIPDAMSAVVGALLEPLGVAIHAIDLADVSPGSDMAIIGSGPIGLLILIALRARGLVDIRAIEPLAHRSQIAARLGAVVVEETEHHLCDIVFETSGTDDGLATALARTRPGGRIVVVGIPDEDITTLRASLARRKELSLIWCRRMGLGDLRRAAVLAGKHHEVIEGLVSHRYPLHDAAIAFDTLAARRGLKVVMIPEVVQGSPLQSSEQSPEHQSNG